MRKIFAPAIFLSLLITSTPLWAGMEDDIRFILKAKNPPAGVVFEIVEGKQEALNWALPKIQEYGEKLRKQHPGIKIAVVSHGSEQFGLLTENQKSMPDAHQRVKSLVSENVPVHVCGTHASWYHKEESDFPEYVDVVPAGPEKVSEYQRRGYALVEMEKP
ncbi:MAG: DsrE family protein [Gammaproteobacteria bacterium]|nr:DsrE family protein [Gammaproteobacteria bacterium]